MGCASSQPSDNPNPIHQKIIEQRLQENNVDFNMEEYHGIINWNDIKENKNYTAIDSALGSGGFGVVVKGFYCPKNLSTHNETSRQEIEIAIKVITRNQVLDHDAYEKLLIKLHDMVEINHTAEEKVILKSCYKLLQTGSLI